MPHRLIKQGELHLYGAVGGDVTWEDEGLRSTGFTDEQVNEALAELSGDIAVRLNSAGGLAFQGIAIYNALKTYAGKVTVYVDALAASAASVIAMAGDTVIMRPGSMLMIHNPASITWGTAAEHRSAAATLDEIAASAAEIYAKRSGRPTKQILQIMADETWLRGDAARSLGFADEVEDSGEEMSAPVFKYSLFKRAPAQLLHRAVAVPGNSAKPATAAQQEVFMTATLTAETATKNYHDIFESCRSARLSMDDTDKVIKSAAGNVDKAREIIIDMIADRAPPATISHLQPDQQGNGLARAAETDLVNALTARLGGKAAHGDNEFMSASLIQMGRSFFERNGAKLHGVSDTKLAEMMMSPSGRASGVHMMGGMHTTSDFPLLLQSAGQRALLERFAQNPTALKALSAKRNANDFRQQSFIRPGEAPELLKVEESGEIKYGTMSEDGFGLKIDTYARLFALSRQAFVNDDLGAFADFIRTFADGAIKTEGNLFFGLLSANSYGGVKLSDGKNFFHADHGNLAQTGAPIGIGSISLGRKAMRQQKGLNTDSDPGTGGVAPAVLLVGPALETDAQKLVADINAATVDDVNPFGGKLSVAVENRYSGNGWWLFADPKDRPAFMHGYLGSAEGPQISTRDGWDVLGTEFRCVLDFGCAPQDYRAAYFNPGT